jgi:hypothetical protein
MFWNSAGAGERKKEYAGKVHDTGRGVKFRNARKQFSGSLLGLDRDSTLTFPLADTCSSVCAASLPLTGPTVIEVIPTPALLFLSGAFDRLGLVNSAWSSFAGVRPRLLLIPDARRAERSEAKRELILLSADLVCVFPFASFFSAH